MFERRRVTTSGMHQSVCHACSAHMRRCTSRFGLCGAARQHDEPRQRVHADDSHHPHRDSYEEQSFMILESTLCFSSCGRSHSARPGSPRLPNSPLEWPRQTRCFLRHFQSVVQLWIFDMMSKADTQRCFVDGNNAIVDGVICVMFFVFRLRLLARTQD